MDPDDLPSPESLASDLTTLAHSLDRFPALRLPDLEALPSVIAWRPPGRGEHLSEPERRALAIEYAITDAIAAHTHPEEKKALAALFTFADLARTVKARQDAAADALGLKSGDSFRNSREQHLLRSLADNIYRCELVDSMRRYDALRDSGRMGVTWWRTVEFDWGVAITEERPNEQLWQFRHILRCMASVSQPLFVIHLPWTGVGPHRPETVKVLSGPAPGDSEAQFAHTLLRIRPALPGAAHARTMAYIWDLGAPLTEGDEVEINFTQELVDEANSFIPVIESYTRPDTIARRMSLRAKVPPSMATAMRGEMTPKPLWQRDAGSITHGPVGRPAKRQPIKAPDADGYYVYEAKELLPSHNYALRWD